VITAPASLLGKILSEGESSDLEQLLTINTNTNLRRHMEDGCSKRFDIETVDFRPQDYNSSSDQNSLRLSSQTRSSGGNSHHRQASYGTSMHYSSSPGHTLNHTSHENGALTSSSGTFLERQEYLAGGDASHDPVWSN
jgi:hypothetical protein